MDGLHLLATERSSRETNSSKRRSSVPSITWIVPADNEPASVVTPFASRGGKGQLNAARAGEKIEAAGAAPALFVSR
jgi:hypothetical protein